jgi:hypothetical protein
MRGTEIDFYNVVGSSLDDDGFLGVLPDAYGERGGPLHEVHHPAGLWHMPQDPGAGPGGQPDPAKAAHFLSITQGSRSHAILLHDVRSVPKLPLGVAGETVLYNGFGAFTRYRADGAIFHATTTTGGSSDGVAVVDTTTPTSHQRYGPWGRERFDKTGYRLRTTAGARFYLGYVDGVVPGIKTTAGLQADAVDIQGNKSVTIAPAGGQAMGVAKAQPLVTVLTAIATALQSIQSSLSLITPSSGGGSGGGPAAAACLSAVEAAVSQVSGALQLIQTGTAIG